MRSELVIRELAGERREVRLLGPGLPKQGSAAWGGSLRAKTTWYPGNSANATQQIMGTTEKQTTFAGEWNSTRLSRTPCIYVPTPGQQVRVAQADALREILESMFRAGSLLDVLWVNAEAATFGARSIHRTGRAIDWNFNYARMDDLEWTIIFEWTGRGADQQKVVAFRNDPTNSTSVAKIEALGVVVDEAVLKTKIQLTRRMVPNSATRFTLGQLDQLASAPSRLLRDFSQAMNRVSNRVSTIGGLINRTKGLPQELAGQMLNATVTAIQAAQTFYDAVSRSPPEALEGQQSLASLTRAACYFKGGVDAANTVQAQAYPVSAEIRAQIDLRRATGVNGIAMPTGANAAATLNGATRQVQTHVVAQGETFLSISVLYYGVVDGAYGIAFCNAMSPKSIPPVGRVLIIPPMNAGPQPGDLPPVAAAGGPTNQPGGVGQTPGSPLWPRKHQSRATTPGRE